MRVIATFLYHNPPQVLSVFADLYDTFPALMLVGSDNNSWTFTLQASPVETAILSRLIPFNKCSEDELTVLCDHAWVITERKGYVIAKLDTTDEWDYYLLEGELALVSSDQKVLTVHSDTEAALHPVAHLQPRKYTIRAQTPVRFLRVQKALLASLKYAPSEQATMLFNDEDDQGLKKHPLYIEISDDLLNDKLVLPSLPDVAVKIRQMVDQEDSSTQKVARFIQTDPAISAKLMKISNGALYHGLRPVESCQQAITRLGLHTTKNLVVGFVLRNLFNKNIHNALLTHQAQQLWEHSVEVGAIAQVLAEVTPGMNPDEALLVGLLHDIGELVILSYAEKYPEIATNDTALKQVIHELKGKLGAMILREWDFSEAFVTAAQEAENWCRDPGPRPDYCDITIIAQLHSFVGTEKMEGLPHLAEVPAFCKIAHGELSPKLSMKLLDQAKEQITEVRQLLTG